MNLNQTLNRLFLQGQPACEHVIVTEVEGGVCGGVLVLFIFLLFMPLYILHNPLISISDIAASLHYARYKCSSK